MTPDDVLSEIRSTFRAQMDSRPNFPFQFLQPSGCGSSALVIPSVSASFQWTAQQVAKLSTTKGNIYILVKDKLTVDDELEVNNHSCGLLV